MGIRKEFYGCFNLRDDKIGERDLFSRVLSLSSRKNPGCGLSRGSQNLGAKTKGGEEE